MSREGEHAPRDAVVDALSERVEVEAVVERSEDNLVVVTIRLPDGIAEQARLATEEWVHE